VQFGRIAPILQLIVLLISYMTSRPIIYYFSCGVFKFDAFDCTCWRHYGDAAIPGDRAT